MGEHVLVTGGAGFVGSHLVDALLAQGHQVRVLDSLEPQVHGPSGGALAYLNSHAELVRGSVTDAAAVARALEGVDVVFHEAALVGVGQSMYDIVRYCQVNTVGAAILLEQVVKRRDRIRKVVVASSMSVYGEGAYRTLQGEMRSPRVRSRDLLERGEWELRDAVTGAPLEPLPTPETKPLQPTSVPHSHRRAALFQHLWRAPGAVEPLHRHRGDLFSARVEQQAAAHLRGWAATPGLHPRVRHRGGQFAGAGH